MIQWPKYHMPSTASRRPSSSHTDTRLRLAVVDGAPVGDEALGHLGLVERHQLAVGVVGQQVPRLLERLADRGDPEGQATRADAQPGRRLDVGAAAAPGLQVVGPVGGVDGAAGEHVGAADERPTAGCGGA